MENGASSTPAKPIVPEEPGAQKSYLLNFEGLFTPASNGRSKSDSTTVELHSLHNPATFICKHCNCRGSFVEVSRQGTAHNSSCPRYSTKKTFSLDEESSVLDSETVHSIREKLRSSLIDQCDAAANNGVIIYKQHIKGPAYLSGLISNGDQIVSVDDTDVGA